MLTGPPPKLHGTRDILVFKEILVPVIGGLGLFLLGLEFMQRGIQALSVNRMRALMAKMAGSPAKGVVAGTIITGIIQSSTAMTVMTVGLVNAGVLGLRGAIGVVMGANIGTTLGNGRIALPLGSLGLLFGGIFAIVYSFAKSDRWRNISLAAMGFALVFYGLNLMTGGLKPLRQMPQVMEILSNLDASTYAGVISCALIAALITALIHSSSATIGIIMGLGAAGVLDWQTCIAFAIGADLGTTITSWIASWNASQDAKPAAYAHIGFNLIGVCVALALFFPAISVLTWVMGFFGGDPGTPVIVDGKETYPLVPVAVGLFSICFNIFNVLILFPFINVFERVLKRIGRSDDDVEDYSAPKYLDSNLVGDFGRAVPAMRQEVARALAGAAIFLAIARGRDDAPKPADHHGALDALTREIRGYSAQLFKGDLSREQMDLVASMIEEADFVGSLSESLHQIARRVQREQFSPDGRGILNEGLAHLERKLLGLEADSPPSDEKELLAYAEAAFEAMRWQVIDAGEIPATEKGALLALLGSMERAESLIDRIAQEQLSVDRDQAVVLAAKP